MEPHNNTLSKDKESPSPQPPTVLSLSPIPVMADNLKRSTSNPFPASTTDSSEKVVAARSFLPHNPNRPPPHSYQRLHEFPPFPPLTQHPVLPFITTAFSNTRVLHGDKPLVKAKPLAPRASTTQRHVQSNISTIPTMDVSKNDPSAIFIRSPWVVPYPQSKEGSSRSNENEPIPGTPLTYALMHTHLNWFLDADDFQKDNPDRVDYPPELEPPRGWAPLTEAANQSKQAKEIERNNNIRTKGSYAPGNDSALEYGPLDECHEKTVLRCTFCRREYHGPNAKSMWRRHVFDKHKVAMKNRREGSAGTSRSGARKSKSKSDGSSQPNLPLASPHLDTPTLTLDLTNEQNLVRLLERVVSGNANISLPSALFSQGRTQNIDLEAITEILRKSGLSVILQKDPPSEECFVTPPTTDGESSQDSSSTPLKQQAIESVSPRFFVAEASPPAEHQRNPLLWHSHKDDDTDANADISTVWDRAPLKDTTMADRNYHNTPGTPGTPGKDKGKQKALPVPRTPNGSKISSTYPSPSLHRNPFTPRLLPSTAMRARALATTGQESYLIASSPALSSPLRGPNRMMLTPGSPSKSKTADHMLSNDDLAVLLSPYRGMTESENAYIFDNVPLEVSSVRRSNWSPTMSLGPPAPLSVKRPRSKSRTGARRVQNDDSELQYPPKTSPHKEDHDMDLAYRVESSPLESVQRRRSAADTKMHMNGFNLNDFLDLDDIASGLASSAPSTPHKPSLAREFSKEFGLLSQEEVDRLTGSACFEEEARSSKRRKVDLTH